MALWTKIRNLVTNPQNIAATVAAPFTAGASLAFLEDNAGNSVLDNITGAKQVKDANAANLAEAERNREFNANEAQKNRDWQEQMSNTAITRQVKDLTNAGINPILASQLGGATVGSGSSATGTPAQVQAEPGYGGLASTVASIAGGFGAVGAGVNQMAQAAKTNAELPYVPKAQKANIANTTADTVQKQAQTQNISANTQKTQAETENLKQQFTLMSIQEQQAVLDLATAYVNADNDRLKAEIERKFNNTWFGRQMKYTGLTLSSVLPILGPIGQMTKKSSGGITINNN